MVLKQMLSQAVDELLVTETAPKDVIEAVIGFVTDDKVAMKQIESAVTKEMNMLSPDLKDNAAYLANVVRARGIKTAALNMLRARGFDAKIATSVADKTPNAVRITHLAADPLEQQMKSQLDMFGMPVTMKDIADALAEVQKDAVLMQEIDRKVAADIAEDPPEAHEGAEKLEHTVNILRRMAIMQKTYEVLGAKGLISYKKE